MARKTGRSAGHPAPKHNGEAALTPEEAEKYRKVIQLRTAGITFDAIAKEVGYANRSGAKHAYDAAIRRWGRSDAQDARELEELRLDDLWRRTFSRISALNAKEQVDEFVKLTTTAVRISSRRAGLLGLDAPKQFEVAGPGGGPIETDIGEALRERLELLRNRDVDLVPSDGDVPPAA